MLKCICFKNRYAFRTSIKRFLCEDLCSCQLAFQNYSRYLSDCRGGVLYHVNCSSTALINRSHSLYTAKYRKFCRENVFIRKFYFNWSHWLLLYLFYFCTLGLEFWILLWAVFRREIFIQISNKCVVIPSSYGISNAENANSWVRSKHPLRIIMNKII